MAHPVINIAEFERGGTYCQQTGNYSGDYGYLKAVGTQNVNFTYINSTNIANLVSGCVLQPQDWLKGKFLGFTFTSGNLVAYKN